MNSTERYPITTGTISEAEAERKLARVREIMKEAELPFGPATDIFIKEEQNAETRSNGPAEV